MHGYGKEEGISTENVFFHFHQAHEETENMFKVDITHIQ